MNKYLEKIAEQEDQENSALHHTLTAVAADAPAGVAGGWIGSKIGRMLGETEAAAKFAKTSPGKLLGHLGNAGEIGTHVGGLGLGAAAIYASFKHQENNRGKE